MGDPTGSDRRALSGLRVLDLTQVMAGPFCAMLLCDMGAEVIKLEPPAGDPTRHWGGGLATDTPAFNAVNRGKQSIVVDLKSPAGAAVARRLAGTADILVENFRPGVMARLGLDYATLSAGHPGLIYASVSGYGQTGPSAAKGGFDLIAQGVSGIMSVTGEGGRPPVKAGVPVTDLGAGLLAVTGILAALHHRTATGRGQHVETSLVDAGVALSVWEAVEYFTTGRAPQPVGSAHRTSAPYQAIRCADGYITMGAATDRLFARLCDVLGRGDWIHDPRFGSNEARVRHQDQLAAAIEAVTETRPRRWWIERLDAAGVPCGPINTYDEVFRDPQIVARQMVVETEHPTLGRMRTLGTPVKLSETPLRPGRPAPLLGANTDDVLRAAGYTADEIARLRADRVVDPSNESP